MCLTIASLAAQYSMFYMDYFPLKHGFKRLVSVGGENNIPTWYSSSALLLASFLITVIAFAKKATDDKYAIHWKALAIIFLCLSIDEAASLHEALGDVLFRFFPTKGYLYYIWVIPGMIFVLAVVLANVRFLSHLPAKTRYQFLTAGAVFIIGAIGLEMVAASYEDMYDSMGLAILTAAEEFTEMMGIVIFIYALCSYISSHIKNIQLTFSTGHFLEDEGTAMPLSELRPRKSIRQISGSN